MLFTRLEAIMNSYIIRIYRQEKEQPRSVIGTAERVGDEGKRPFKNVDELWEILNATGRKPKRKNKGIERILEYCKNKGRLLCANTPSLWMGERKNFFPWSN